MNHAHEISGHRSRDGRAQLTHALIAVFRAGERGVSAVRVPDRRVVPRGRGTERDQPAGIGYRESPLANRERLEEVSAAGERRRELLQVLGLLLACGAPDESRRLAQPLDFASRVAEPAGRLRALVVEAREAEAVR